MRRIKKNANNDAVSIRFDSDWSGARSANAALSDVEAHLRLVC